MIDSAAAHEYSYILMTFVMRDVTGSNVAPTAVIYIIYLVDSPAPLIQYFIDVCALYKLNYLLTYLYATVCCVMYIPKFVLIIDLRFDYAA